MDRPKTLPIIILMLVLAGFFIWAMLPKDDLTKTISEKLSTDKEKADVIFQDATLSEIYDGVKYWELLARTAVINKTTGLAKMSAVDGLFFDKGKPAIKFLAPSATWYINKNEIQLVTPIGYDIRSEMFIKEQLEKVTDRSKIYSLFHLPSIKPKISEGFWFQAKNLSWKLATKKLLCTGAISLTKGNAVINAERLEADVGMEKVLLTGNPKAEIETVSGKIVTTAREFLVDSGINTIIANNDVTIKKGTSRIITGKSVYDQKKGSISLFGDVQITDQQITAFSKSASYDVNSSKVVLMGKAKAKRGENEIYGEKMTIYLGKNKIVVEGRTKVKIKEAEIK